MINFLSSQIPDWARPSHPILQYELSRLKTVGIWRTRVISLFVLMLILGLLGYVYATYIYESPTKGNITDFAWRALYFPTLFLQIITNILALSLGIGSIGQERSNKTWDNLRATENGAEFILRARWIAILYRLRGIIIAILLVRVVLVLGMLYDLTAFGGLYAEMLTANITPAVPSWHYGLIVIALLMTINLLLPLTMIASSAGIGILISVAIKDRAYSGTIQIILVFLQLAVTIGLIIGISQFLSGGLELPDEALFALFLAHSSFGDWGLLFAQLGSVGEIWAIVPYGILIGLGLVIIMLIQSAITDGMLSLAVRLSEGRE